MGAGGQIWMKCMKDILLLFNTLGSNAARDAWLAGKITTAMQAIDDRKLDLAVHCDYTTM